MFHRYALCAALLAAAAAGPSLAGPNVEPLTTERVAAGLVRPILATHAPGDFTRLYIIEKQGRIRVLNLKTGVLSPVPFLDIDPLVGGGTSNFSEQGLLGLAFHHDYPDTDFFYVNYTNNSGDTVVARYETTSPDLADPASATFILTIDQPFSNHNGGWIGFGPDDYLYISTGDGGSGGDPGNRAQTITNMLLGKLLRIDVDGGVPYAIPPSNPFVGITGDDEIWAYGLRNAWRPSFDRVTGDLYIADVGQNAWEEIDFQPAASTGGENYGWRCYEGNHVFNLVNCPPASTMVFPIHEYSHGVGLSITGGYVYRGCDIPTLDGTYFFADYVTDRIWSFDYDGTNVNNFTDRTLELRPAAGSITDITSFGEDARGELYICDQLGEVWKIVPVTPTISPADFDCNGAVDVLDLLALLAAWGPCDGCVEDINGDGVVDVLDLLDLLAMWG